MSTAENSDSSRRQSTRFLIERRREQREKPLTAVVKQAIPQINAISRMHIVTLVARRGILLRCASLPTVGSLLRRRYVKSLVEISLK